MPTVVSQITDGDNIVSATGSTGGGSVFTRDDVTSLASGVSDRYLGYVDVGLEVYFGCYLFDVDIEPGVVGSVTDSLLRLYMKVPATGASGQIFRVYAEKSLNPNMPTLVADYKTRPLTVAYGEWSTIADVGYVDITGFDDVILEVLSQDGWVSGKIMIYFDFVLDTPNHWYNVIDYQTNQPILQFGYTMAPTSLDLTNEFLTDLIDRRGLPSVGGNPHRFVELYGGEQVEITAFEPDPVTFRGKFYYNSVKNVLYQKVIVENKPELGHVVAFWQPVSIGSS